MTDVALSDGVKALAGAVQAALGAAGAGRPVDAALASFAVERHRVGTLLHMGIERGLLAADQDATTSLSQDWLANKTRCNTSALTTARVGQALAKGGIGFLAFKGVAMGQALYPTPAWRHCGDIDILVSTDSLSRAADLLSGAGLRSNDPVFALPPSVRRFALRTLRDIRIDDLQFGNKIELHSRLVFSRAISAYILAVDPTFRPRLPERASEPPAPSVGAGLAYYLLLHGAVSGWTRFKWLADILCILGKLDSATLATIAGLAENAGTAKAVKAGLQLAVAAFPMIELGPLQRWLAEPAASDAVRERAAAYAAWLNAPSDATANPLHTRNSGLRSQLMLVDSRWAQVMTLPPSGLAAGLRTLAQRMQASRS
jgi:hypothetical protein